MPHCLEKLAERYPRLYVPVSEGASVSEDYRRLSGRGEIQSSDHLQGFTLDSHDSFESCDTPAGSVEVLTLANRQDFEQVVTCLAHRCEPTLIPASMGATTLIGLTDWGKIEAHKRAWIEAGGNPELWGIELMQFARCSENISNTLIVLSSGYYSAVSPDKIGLDATRWIADSLSIRKYHELTHFVSRKLFPQNKNALRDEVLADCIGLWATYGVFNVDYERLFLGIREDDPSYCAEKGRLRNYLQEGQTLEDAILVANRLIDEIAQVANAFAGSAAECFSLLLEIEKVYEHSSLS